MEKIFVLTLAFWGMCLSSVSAQVQDSKIDLELIYQKVDEAIAQSPQYVAEYEKQLNKQKSLFLGETDPEKKLQIGMGLFDMYRSFKNDSALYYISRCITMADNLGESALAGHARAKMARQCSNSGMYVEAGELLRQVNSSVLSKEGKTDYYEACNHLYGEIANYSLVPEVKSRYYNLQRLYRDSLESVSDEGSNTYLMIKMWELLGQNKVHEALKISDIWMNRVGENTRDDAMASYFRHIVYAYLGDSIMVRYWLGKSALADIKCAVMDQASLITLAEKANDDGETERSYKYIRFTWDCNNFFNTRMRSSQISPVLNVIEQNYQDVASRNTRILAIASFVFISLTVLLFLFFFYTYRQKRQLSKTKKELQDANEQLLESNSRLKRMNDWVTQCNKELFDINEKLKQENSFPPGVSQ